MIRMSAATFLKKYLDGTLQPMLMVIAEAEFPELRLAREKVCPMCGRRFRSYMSFRRHLAFGKNRAGCSWRFSHIVTDILIKHAVASKSIHREVKKVGNDTKVVYRVVGSSIWFEKPEEAYTYLRDVIFSRKAAK